ncbi:aminoglycoside phosphotransferase family protein [Deinococcus sp. YIM 134068]|uniref:aminoglycoside phosphotransferase family protein n=1 Tax=Deinococcus lichenicola TaxID=3118910 RepID=UPI002F9569DB
MAAEPTLSRTALLGVVRSTYGLDVNDLTFLPGGTAPAYRAEGPGGSFFLKVLPNTPSGLLAAGRVAAEVPLLHALRRSGVLTRVPRPVPTLSGADLAEVEGQLLVVHGWSEGENLSADWRGALDALAPLLGRLHAGTRQVTSVVAGLPVPPEDFDLPFERSLTEDLRLLRDGRYDARPGVQALRDLLLPLEADLERLLARARFFQQAVRSQSREFVLCHTDAHGGNVMRDAAGELWIIDWETARLAPPEHDLWMLHARLPEVLPAYEAAAGRKIRLAPNVLGFYFLRRVLEDLAYDVALILHENTRPEQDAANLGVLERHILPSLARTEEELAWLEAALRS